MESPNLMEEEWAVPINKIVRARVVVEQDLVINGVFCGIQSVRMAIMRLHPSVHLDAQTICQTWESPVPRSQQGEALENQ